jgi:hypothetical protein
MILAHLPAGYLVGRSLGARKGPVLWACLIASVLPDFDMFWFHFVDNGAIHHHRYWVHVPGFWAMVAAVCLPLCALFAKDWLPALAAGFLSLFVHMVLDSIGGGIMWLWPWSDTLFSLVTVPATQSHWVLSFILHWSFLFEVVIIGLTAFLLFRKPIL